MQMRSVDDLEQKLKGLKQQYQNNHGSKTQAELKRLLTDKQRELGNALLRNKAQIEEKQKKIESLGSKGSPRAYLENYLQMGILKTINHILLNQAVLRNEVSWIAKNMNEKFGPHLGPGQIEELIRIQAAQNRGIASLRAKIDRNIGSIFKAYGRAAENLQRAMKERSQRLRRNKKPA